MKKLMYIYYVLLAFLEGTKFSNLSSIRGRIRKDKNVDIIFNGKSRIFSLEVTGNGKMIINEGVEVRGLYAHLGNGAQITLSQGSFIGKDVKIISYSNILIGKESLISPNVIILDNDHVINSKPIKHSGLNIKETIIGNNCWVGASSIICKGSFLNDGSVLGAMSLLNIKTDKNSLYVGQPARKKRDIGPHEEI